MNYELRIKGENGRIILGIDPGTGRLGWAILAKSKVKSQRLKEELKLINCGLIETPPKTPTSERLEVIYKQICQVIKKYQPTELAIEELFFVKNVKTGISVAQARGVVMLACELAKLTIFEYKPNEVKLAISGYGHADKSQMCKMLKLHLKGCKIEQDDTVDAVAVALCHLQQRRIRNKND